MPTFLIPLLLVIATASALALLLQSRRRRGAECIDPAEPREIPGDRKPDVEAEFDPSATRIILKTASNAPIKRAGGVVIAGAKGQLVSLSGVLKNSRFDITDRGLTIGRSPACDIQLADRRVSARHAWIGIVGGKVMLRDLESTNGTFINAATNTPIHEAELHPNDTLFFGGHLGEQFRFVIA